MNLNFQLLMLDPMLNDEICKKFNWKNDIKNKPGEFGLTC
jgi:hypothetical protein